MGRVIFSKDFGSFNALVNLVNISDSEDGQREIVLRVSGEQFWQKEQSLEIRFLGQIHRD